MVDNWITPQMLLVGIRRDNFLVTLDDAAKFLSTIDQNAYYEKHAPKFSASVWKGERINGVDVSAGRKRFRDVKQSARIKDSKGKEMDTVINMKEEYIDPADQHIVAETGHAYVIKQGNRTIVFQPHVPGMQGYHALTSRVITTPKTGKLPSVCPLCKQDHDVEEYMAKALDESIKNSAQSEIATKFLYTAQELQSDRISKLLKLMSTMG
jgi:hypothetical protein